MSSTDTTPRAPQAKLTGPGFSAALREFSFAAQVNAAPGGSITVLPDNQSELKAIDILAQDFSKNMADAQRFMFGSSSPLYSVEVQDGQGNTCVFPGRLCSPGFGAEVGQVGYSYQFIHPFVDLERLDMTIYNRVAASDPLRGSTLGLYLAGEQGHSIAERISHLITAVIDHYHSNLARLYDKDPVSLLMDEARDAVNKLVLPMFMNFLNESVSDTSFAWLKGDKFNTSASINQELNAFLLRRITQPSESFSAVLGQLLSDFQMFWVPYYSLSTAAKVKAGTYGKMQYWGNVFDQAPTVKDVEVTGFQFAGGGSLFPVTHVYINSGSMDNKARDSYTYTPLIAQHPAIPYAGGRILRVDAPHWLGLVDMDSTHLASDPAVGYLSGMDMTGMMSAHISIANIMARVSGVRHDVLQEWTRAIYLLESLADSTFGFSCPLDLSYEVGTRYQINATAKDTGQSIKVTGMAARVEHRLMTQGDRNGTCSSNVTLTHVEAGDFQLPHKAVER